MNKELYDLSFEMRRNFRRRLSRILVFAALTFIAINLVLQFIVFPVRQKSVSMEPDIPRSACLFFSPLKKSLSRGDIVLVRPSGKRSLSFPGNVFESLAGFFTARQVQLSNLNHFMGKSSQIRRVLALPGDTVYMRDYVLYIKPEGENYFLTEFELVEKPYNVSITASPAFWDNAVGVKGSFDEVTLKDGEYYVFGDNRNSAVDSRLWGAVKKDRIQAAALAEYFPFSKFKFF